MITIRPLLAYYFGATPLFFLLDIAWDLSVRASFLADLEARLAYYGFCLVCGTVAWLRPGKSAWVGMGESAVTIGFLVIGFMRPILSLPGELAADPMAELGAPVTGESIVNFVIAAGVAWWSFQRWGRAVATRRKEGPPGRSGRGLAP